MSDDVVETLLNWVEAIRQPTVYKTTFEDAALFNGGCVTEDMTTAADTIVGLRSAIGRLRTERDAMRDGNRPLPYDRDHLGRLVREAWVRWAYTQPNPKPSWLVDYAELSEPDKEADRQIGESIARWTIIGDAARTALAPSPAEEKSR